MDVNISQVWYIYWVSIKLGGYEGKIAKSDTLIGDESNLEVMEVNKPGLIHLLGINQTCDVMEINKPGLIHLLGINQTLRLWR